MSIESIPGTIKVQRSLPGAHPEETVEYIDVPYFPDGAPPASCSFSIDYTRQLKQFEPIKIGVWVDIPSLNVDSEIKAALKRAQDIATEKLGESKKSLDALVKAGG